MTLIWPFEVTKGQTDHAIRSATYEFLLVFYSIYSAISHRYRFSADDLDPTIWPFKVTKGQIDHAIRSTTYEFL